MKAASAQWAHSMRRTPLRLFRLLLLAAEWLPGVLAGEDDADPSVLHCREWCENKCITLNGNVADECGECSAKFACWPGATDFSTGGREEAAMAVADTSDPAGVDATAPMDHQSPPPPPPMMALCPTDEYTLKHGLQSLPVLKRYCQRGVQQCASVQAALDWHLEHIQPAEGLETRPALFHRERPSVGAGFAHVLQEQAQTLLLGLALARPVWSRLSHPPPPTHHHHHHHHTHTYTTHTHTHTNTHTHTQTPPTTLRPAPNPLAHPISPPTPLRRYTSGPTALCTTRALPSLARLSLYDPH